MAIYQLKYTQKIPASVSKVWDFISSPNNLKRITPPKMGFDITTEQLPGKIYAGMIITYKVKPFLGISMSWVTEITHVEPQRYFVDEQRMGPYTMWHHEHFVEAVDEGVRMTDIVSYKPPYGILGALANQLFIRRQLRSIFNYRFQAIENIFGRAE